MTHPIHRPTAKRAPDPKRTTAITLVTPMGRITDDLHATLARGGISLQRFVPGAVRGNNQGLALIDLRRAQLSTLAQNHLLGETQQYPFRFAFITDRNTDSNFLDQLTEHGEIIPEIDVNGGDAAHVLKEMHRMVALEAEVARRAAVINTAGEKPQSISFDPAQDRPHHVLVAGSPGPAMLPLINLIEARGGQARAVYRSGQAIRALESGTFTGAIFLTEKTGDPLNALARAVRRHQRFYTMPVINIAEAAARPPSDSPAGRPLSPDDLLEKINPILNSGHRRATRHRHFIQCAHHQNKTLFIAYQTLGARKRQHLIAAHLDSIFDRHDGAVTPAPFILLQTRHIARRGASSQKTPFRSNFGGQVREHLYRSVRKSDFIVPLSESTDQDIHALYVPGAGRDDLDRLAGRLESLLRSTALRDKANPNPARTLVTSRGFMRPPGLRLEETVAGMIHKLSVA
ncbi:MAG: hypothetical protein AAFY13_10715 [Pseudomonadota bacterium]